MEGREIPAKKGGGTDAKESLFGHGKLKKALVPLLAINFIGVLGFSIVLPFLVFLVISYGGNAFIYGVVGATYPAFQLIGAPILGRWSDYYGRRRILFLSQLGTLLSWVLFLIALFLPVVVIFEANLETLGSFAITLPLLVLFVARALDGITGGNVSVANAYLADITEESERNRNFGWMSVSANLGFIVGPALAGILGSTIFGEAIPVIAALLISLAGLVVIVAWLPESRQCVYRAASGQKGLNKIFGLEHMDCSEAREVSQTGFRAILTIPFIPYMLMLYFFIFLGFNIFYTSFSVHAVQGLEWTIAQLGIFFSVLSIFMIIVQGPILSRLSQRISEAPLIISGSFLLGIGFVLFVSENIQIIYLGAIFFAVGNGLMWPSFLSSLSKAAGETNQGAVQGFAGSTGSLASIIGLIGGGIIYSSVQELTFLLTSAVIFVVAVLALHLLTIERRKPGQTLT